MQAVVHERVGRQEAGASLWLQHLCIHGRGGIRTTCRGTSASSQSDADQLSMLVPEVEMLEPEVKIRLAKERPFRQVGFEILKVFV